MFRSVARSLPAFAAPARARAVAVGAASVVAAVAAAATTGPAQAETPHEARELRTPYPAIEPYRTGRLQVSPVHNLYFEECGNPNGKPVVFLHGGPGGGCTTGHRCFFDPATYRIILFDQRGSGRSTPHASLEDNTTWTLVGDIEKLRKHLGVSKWQVFGGSWGSTLALAYAESHPSAVTALVLRGIFLLRKKEIDWYYENKGGAEMIFPDAWEAYTAPVAADLKAGRSLVAAYQKLLTGADETLKRRAAGAWSRWEMSTSALRVKAEDVARADDDAFALPFARIENHFFTNKGWFQPESQLLDNVHKIRHIPTVIVQGRYDVVCPARSAWDLHRAFPEAKLVLVQDAGHSANEPGITSALLQATDDFRTLP